MILMVAANFPPEPVVAASISGELAEVLSKNHPVCVITPRPSRPYGYVFNDVSRDHNKYKHVILKSYVYPGSGLAGRFLEYLSFGITAARYIGRQRDHISCCYVSSWPLLGQYFIIRSLKKKGITAIVHVQDVYPESLAGKIPLIGKLIISLLVPADRYVLRNAERVITPSSRMKAYLVENRNLDPARVRVIYNWQDDKLFKSAESETSSTSGLFTFMYAGTLNTTSHVDILIRAYTRSCILNSRLVIAGGGPEKDFLKSLSSQFRSSIIEFRDACREKIPEIQEQADVLILSLGKGVARYSMPSKLQAYMLSSKPVIATIEEDSDTADAIRESGCGWIVPPEDEDILSEVMQLAAATDGKILKEYGVNGRRYALSTYSPGKNIDRLVAVLEETLV